MMKPTRDRRLIGPRANVYPYSFPFLPVLASLASLAIFAPSVKADPATIKVGFLGQVWGDHDLFASSTWQLRRAEFSLRIFEDKNELPDAVLVLDPVSVPTNVIQDLKLRFELSSVTQFYVGQFKIPFGLEGIAPVADLDFVERARIMTSAGLGDRRDIGVMLTSSWQGIKMSIGAFNGSGKNTADSNPSKDTVARLVAPWKVSPALRFSFGASGYLGLDNDRQSFYAGGADVECFASGFILKMEYARGRLGTALGSQPPESEGWQVGLLEYPMDKTQIGIRLDEAVADIQFRSLTRRTITLGINYFVSDHTKIQINGSRSGINDIWKFDTNLLRLNFQASF